MAYSAAQVANYFIDRRRKENVRVDPLKVQKLVYLAHGWHLHFLKEPLITEKIEAWRYGPVVPDLYMAFRQWGSCSIGAGMEEPRNAAPLDSKTVSFLSQIWEPYSSRSGIELSMLTHEPGRAWDLVRRANDTPWNDAVIDNELIADEFRRRKAKA